MRNLAEFSLDELNRVKDWNNLTDLEKKHVPIIKAPDRVKVNEPFEIEIIVGEFLKHPNELNHWIRWVSVFLNERMLSSINLEPVVSEPKVKISIKYDKPGKKKLVAMANCNLHGTWINEKEIEFV